MLANITAKEYMTANLVTLAASMDVLEAIQILLNNRVTGAPVVDAHGNIIGMFSEADCMDVVLHAAYNQSMAGKVSEFMTKDVVTVDCDASIVEVAEMFSNSRARNFPVVEDVDLVGVISRVDVLRALTSLR